MSGFDALHGVHADRIARNTALCATLRSDHMDRFSAVPATVMINQWQEDLPWLIVDSTYPGQISRRHQLLLERRDMVIDRLPGADVEAAELELRDMVAAYLPQAYPDYFQREGDLLLSPLTGLAVDVGPAGADPLVAIALLATEDMLLLLPATGGAQHETVYQLKAGALLFPNDWSLRSHFRHTAPDTLDPDALAAWERARQASLKAARLGKSPYEIHHGHVSHYIEHFATRVDLFFDRMQPGLRTWRRNWGMRLSDELFLHSDLPPAALPEPSAHNWAEHGFLRSEHETFTKLANSRAVVFTIKTYLWKLSELVKQPIALHALIVANDNLAQGMVDYRAALLPTFRSFLEGHRPHRPPSGTP